MRLWSISGNSQRLDGGAMFGNVPKALWSRWIEPDTENRIPLACRCLLVRDLNGHNVLFETGIGAFFEPGLRKRYGVQEDHHVLLDGLAALGLGDEDIDIVVLSHLHFDHAGGLLAPYRKDEPLKLLFPRARFIIGRSHWQRARQPHPRDRASFIPGLCSLLEQTGRLELVEGESSAVLGPQVRFSYSEGHTPGLMLAEIQPAPGVGGGLVFCADLIPGKPWVHLPVTMGYDRYAECLIDEKRAFLDDKRARGVRLFFTHDAETAIAEVGCDERGRYVAVRSQTSVQDMS